MRHRSFGARLGVALGAVAAVALGAAVPVSGAEETAGYIVQMSQSPVVAYEGGIAGLPATKAAEGQKVNPKAAHVVKYADFLKRAQDRALAKVGGEKL